MAKLVDSKFLIIEAPGSEFLAAGLGGGDATDMGIVKGGIFDGFSMINIESGGFLCCDNCNKEILESETCYYIAVINRVYCDYCFRRWLKDATYYPEDADIERRNYQNIEAMLKEAGIEIQPSK